MLTWSEDSGVADVGQEGGDVAEADRDPVAAKVIAKQDLIIIFMSCTLRDATWSWHIHMVDVCNTHEANTATSMAKACRAGSHARLILRAPRWSYVTSTL